MIGYHFTEKCLRDGRPIPPVGEWLAHEGPVVPCVSGLHASEEPFDALHYAPGPFLHKVELEGDLVPQGNPPDKWCGRRRRILASIDATAVLWEFARDRARSVLHLWKSPVPDVVRRYLETGDESLRSAAEAAACAAARAAARADDEAAEDAAWAAARAGAHAAWDAAGAAAWAAAHAAWAAARDAAGVAAWAAAWAAARAAARADDEAAGAAAWAAAGQTFRAMVERAFAEAAEAAAK